MTAIVVTCEHASARVPASIDLGISPEAARSHAAWDPGAREVAEGLALALSAPLLVGQVSRLVCDLHRRAAHPECVRAEAWGLEVPGNRALSPAAREARLAAFHHPFRRALDAEVSRGLAERGRCLQLSIHSFTPHLPDGERDLDVGVLFRPSRGWTSEICARLLAALRADGFDARPNQPYQGVGEASTTWLEERLPDAVYAGVEIELSQRLDPEALRRVTSSLAAAAALE